MFFPSRKIKVLPGFIKQRTCLLLLLDNFICNNVEVQTERAVWHCQSGLHPFVKAAVTIFRISHNKQTVFWYENRFIKNNAWVSLGHFWCSAWTFFSTTHITSSSHSAGQLLINSCMCSVVHSVPHFFTSLFPSSIYSGSHADILSVFHSVCLSPLFSLLRHSREETVSAGFLHGKIGEFKGQLHVTSLFYCTAITIVINAAGEEGAGLQCAEVKG